MPALSRVNGVFGPQWTVFVTIELVICSSSAAIRGLVDGVTEKCELKARVKPECEV